MIFDREGNAGEGNAGEGNAGEMLATSSCTHWNCAFELAPVLFCSHEVWVGSWRWKHGDGIMGMETWRWDYGDGIMGMELWKYGNEIMVKARGGQRGR
ncbi:hypothetical protein BDV97DRAFT_356934 [Delphinella strobiligena]|nr:hypothetical protein BDV97DRAFT_356934 [Delphinella strobiligena]